MAFTLAEYLLENPDPMLAAIVDVVTNTAEMLKRLNFLSTDTMAYVYASETYPGIGFRSLNGDYSALNLGIGAIAPQTETLGVFGNTAKTDSQFANANTRANKIMATVKAASLFFDANFINGDPTTNPNSFLGLRKRLVGNQVLPCGDNGGSLTLDLLDRTLDAVVGTNAQKKLIVSKSVRRKISQLYRPNVGTQQRFIDEYEGAEVITFDEDGGGGIILDYDETMGNSDVTQSLYVVRLGSDVDNEWVQGTTGPAMIQHRGPFEFPTRVEDVVEGRLGIAMFHGRSAARLAGILDQ